MRLGPNIQIARIAGPGDKIPNGDILAAVGFGIIYPHYGNLAWPTQMHYMKTWVHKGNCSQFYEKKELIDDIWCFGGTKRPKTARGDEGGPIFSILSGRVYALINNFHEAEMIEVRPEPTLALDLSMSRDWIYKTIEENLDTADPDGFCE